MNFSNNKFPNRPLELLSIQEREELSAPDNVNPANEVETDDLIPILDISASISNRAKKIQAGQLIEKISGSVFANTSLSNLSDREQAIENLGPFDTAMVTVEGESQAFSLAHQLSRVTDGADRTLSNLTDNEQALENIGGLDRNKNLSDVLNASTALSNLGGMAGSNNLSEIVDAATARSNLGLGTAATANVGQFATAAQGALADTAAQPADLTAVENFASGYTDTAIDDLNLGTASQSNVEDFDPAGSASSAITTANNYTDSEIAGLNLGTAAQASADDFDPAGSAANVQTNLNSLENSLGTAAFADTGQFATSAQGSLADTALQPAEHGTHTIYVSASNGSDTNDGLTPGTPVRNLWRAFEILSLSGPELGGTWTVQMSAGSYAGGAEFPVNITQNNYVYLEGPDVGGHPNVPTAIIDHDQDTNQVFGILVNYSGRLFIRDLLIKGAFEYGLSISRHADVPVANLHLENITTDEVHEF